jgi:hypothetical protein
MTRTLLLAGAALAACVAVAMSARADTVIGVEDPVSGFVGNLFGPLALDQGYIVASDGEAAFDPSGSGFDISDGLDFDAVGHVWTQASDSGWTFVEGQTWAVLSVTSCGSENEPDCEPVGHFRSPDPWQTDQVGTWLILENPNGDLSDRIVTYNTDFGAELKFYSDPSLGVPEQTGGVPEPSAWALAITGFFGLGVLARDRRRALVRA